MVVFLKLGESIYVAMDLIPILLGSLPLAHNAQHSLVNYIYIIGRAGASPPSRTTGPRCLYIYLTKEEAYQLRVQIHGCNLTPQRTDVVKHLPIFTTLENSNEKLYSVSQVSAIRSAQMEPLSFPLSASNLPSNNYYPVFEL